MGYLADNFAIEKTTPVATDAYHATTALGYWNEGRHKNHAVSYMFARKEPFNGGYTVAAGLEGCIDLLQRWQEHGFSDSDIAWLKAQKRPSGARKYPDAWIEEARHWDWKLKVDAVPEGSLVFPQEPVMRVEGRIDQVKWFESAALGIMNKQQAYATHAARLSDVASKELPNGAPKAKASIQGLRRDEFASSIAASRGLALGGYPTTSTGNASKALGLPWVGTMDHAWVMTHRAEISDVPLKELFKLRDEGRVEELQNALAGDAFRSYVFSHSENGVLLLDSYDSIKGLEKAITVFKEMRELAKERPELHLGVNGTYGIRFDSGDLTAYAKLALRRLAEEGFIEGLDPAQVKDMSDADLLPWGAKSKIFNAPADGLDEYSVQEMREGGAWMSSLGVGTAGSHVAPTGNVYKAACIEMDVRKDPNVQGPMTPVSKVISSSPAKSSNPGFINSKRFYDAEGKLSYIILFDDVLGLDAEGRMVNMRNFSEEKTNPQAAEAGTNSLVPVFDVNGKYVYQEPAKKESFPGSGHMVTDLSQMAEKVAKNLDSLPDAVRRVTRNPDDVLKSTLLKTFKAADKGGEAELNVNIAAMKAQLPAEVQHIPIYIDHKLYEQRRAVEARHNLQAGNGVALYEERFEGGNQPTTPAVSNTHATTASHTQNIDMYIDVQNGFARYDLTPEQGGSLYVPGGEKVGEKIGKMIAGTHDGIIVLSQDFHPADHISFMTSHPGIMAYRKQRLVAAGKSADDVLSPLAMAFDELVFDKKGLIIGIKDAEHDRVRKVKLSSRDGSITEGFVPSATDKGRVSEVLDEYLDTPFSEMKGISTQMCWSPHCVQNTPSCDFVPEMGLPQGLTDLLHADATSPNLKYVDEKSGNTFYVVRKGMNSEIDSYGIGIENDKKTRTTAPEVFDAIASDLADQDCTKAVVNIGGLATNFCVEFSHNNVRDLMPGSLRMRGIEQETNYMPDISAGIPIPGGPADPFSLEGAATRMAQYDKSNPTRIRTSDGVLRARNPQTNLSGTAQVSGLAATERQVA